MGGGGRAGEGEQKKGKGAEKERISRKMNEGREREWESKSKTYRSCNDMSTLEISTLSKISIKKKKRLTGCVVLDSDDKGARENPADDGLDGGEAGGVLEVEIEEAEDEDKSPEHAVSNHGKIGVADVQKPLSLVTDS